MPASRWWFCRKRRLQVACRSVAVLAPLWVWCSTIRSMRRQPVLCSMIDSMRLSVRLLRSLITPHQPRHKSISKNRNLQTTPHQHWAPCVWIAILMSRVTENSVSTIEFYRLFLTKSNGLCWDICWKLRKNNKKIYYFYYFLKDHTISTKTYYFKEWTTILHYQQHKNLLFSTIFYYLYMSALCLRNLNILYYKHFINLS